MRCSIYKLTSRALATNALLLLASIAAAGELTVTSSLEDLLSPEQQAHFAGTLDPRGSIEWEIYLPDSYRDDKPAGVMVYASPLMHGRIPAQWKSVMAQKNLVWVSANRAGNRIAPARRVSYAVLGAVLAKQRYNIDSSRIYIAGLSGGGRVASVVAPRYPGLFRGAIYNCGVNFWGDEAPPELKLVRRNRFVFVTGSEDFNRRETRKIYGYYRKAGVEEALLMDIPHMGHNNPVAADFAAAIGFLDSGIIPDQS